jgi:uncharacterized protein YukE
MTEQEWQSAYRQGWEAAMASLQPTIDELKKAVESASAHVEEIERANGHLKQLMREVGP